MSQSDHPPGFLFEGLSANDHIKFAIKQHISADIKSLFRLAKASGISRNEFENIVQREFEHEHELANVHEPADDNPQEDHNELANENASGDEEELEDEGDDLSDTVSQTSTVEYDHEPFETFRDKVLHFAPTIWGGDNGEETAVNRMAGGGFNRIIGISRRALGQPSLSEYVLRIPRLDSARLNLDVAALLYVRKLGNIPVPEVIAFDTTSNNKLGDRYMVQKKLTGTDMLSTFPNLNHDQKCRVASELGHFFNQILSKKSAVAGKPALPSDLTKANEKSEDLCVEPLFQAEIQTTDQLEPNLMTKDLLCRTFEERKLDAKRRNDTWRPQLMDQFIAMVKELHGDGWFMNNDISLCHLDLEPRNILINAQQDDSQPIISGILDWDSAVLAPSFMSCTPPLWVWAWSEDEEEDERTANDVPPTEEGRELKKLFEEAAGAEFVRYAYPPAYRLARRLVRFAVEELRFAEQFKEAEAMLKEWKGIRGVSKPQNCL